MPSFISIFILASGLSLPPVRAAEVALPSGSGSTTSTGPDSGTNMVGTSAAELSCLLTKADPAVKKENAQTTSEGIENALKKIKFTAGEMSRTGLMHFLSQVLAETGHLRTTEEKGAKSEKKKGWGLIQVTGDDNLKECSTCMDQCSPGDGRKVLSNKAASIGDAASDRTSAALISLCYWKKNVIQNRKHKRVADEKSPTASEEMTQIINAGGIGKKVTRGQDNLDERKKLFTELTSADGGGSCRKI